jgi:predicted lipoprotein with Yx(FWY)xxD motif
MLVRRLANIAALLTVAGTAGCADHATPPAESRASAPATVAASPVPRTVVMVGNVGGRRVLVDQEGHTLYMSTADTKGGSSCLNQCATTWLPLIGDAVNGEGVDGFLLATYTRPDGRQQTTYVNQPLYRFRDDRIGDAKGQGVNGAWFMLDADGEPLRWW